ncbi:MAG TPA: hypothetical protein PKU80_07405 [Candidatus Limiplasma sp.]|nr:hypothetical protein [Candidatus Limiplasma sp.]HRX07745.1 hypothetical protein [Candidatus Limiplasma sp.]
MQNDSPTPKHNKLHRRTRITILIAAVVVVAALISALLLLQDHSKNPYPVRDIMIPGAQLRTLQTPQAMRYDLGTAEQAQAYFERLLGSPYIGLRGDAIETPQETGNGWTVQETNGDGTTLSAAFDSQGIISVLNITTNRSGSMYDSRPQYRLGNGDESLFNYIRTFAYEYLPDVAIDSGDITADTYNTEGRFLTIVANNQYTKGAYRFVVQIDPVQRIVGFETLVDPSLAYIRTSRMAADSSQPTAQPAALAEPLTADTAVQFARAAIADAYSLPADVVDTYILVDVTRYEDTDTVWYGTVYPGAYWVVNLRMPETPEAFYSDYSVFLNDETGEVMRLLDPSNNSNG